MKEKKGYDKQPEIKRRKDAVSVMDEMIIYCATMLTHDARRMYVPRLKAVRKAIARKVI